MLYPKLAAFTPRTAANDGPDVCTSTSPTPPASASQRNYADSSCTPPPLPPQICQSVQRADPAPSPDPARPSQPDWGAVGEFFRSGSSFRNTIGFTSRPTRRMGSAILSGTVSPTAHCILTEQCASICAAVILPQCLSFCGPSLPSRVFTSFATVASNRFFMIRYLPGIRVTLNAGRKMSEPLHVV